MTELQMTEFEFTDHELQKLNTMNKDLFTISPTIAKEIYEILQKKQPYNGVHTNQENYYDKDCNLSRKIDLLKDEDTIISKFTEEFNKFYSNFVFKMLYKIILNKYYNLEFNFILYGMLRFYNQIELLIKIQQIISKYINIIFITFDDQNSCIEREIFNKYSRSCFNKFIAIPIVDFGIPTNDQLIEFWEILDRHLYDDKNHIIMHCSSGLGRTGLMILSYILLNKWRKSQFEVLELENLIISAFKSSNVKFIPILREILFDDLNDENINDLYNLKHRIEIDSMLQNAIANMLFKELDKYNPLATVELQDNIVLLYIRFLIIIRVLKKYNNNRKKNICYTIYPIHSIVEHTKYIMQILIKNKITDIDMFTTLPNTQKQDILFLCFNKLNMQYTKKFSNPTKTDENLDKLHKFIIILYILLEILIKKYRTEDCILYKQMNFEQKEDDLFKKSYDMLNEEINKKLKKKQNNDLSSLFFYNEDKIFSMKELLFNYMDMYPYININISMFTITNNPFIPSVREKKIIIELLKTNNMNSLDSITTSFLKSCFDKLNILCNDVLVDDTSVLVDDTSDNQYDHLYNIISFIYILFELLRTKDKESDETYKQFIFDHFSHLKISSDNIKLESKKLIEMYYPEQYTDFISDLNTHSEIIHRLIVSLFVYQTSVQKKYLKYKIKYLNYKKNTY
jgi:hypothetical protein